LDKATKQKKQKTEWHNISVFGKLAEIVSSYCYKGELLSRPFLDFLKNLAPLHFLKPLPLNKNT
jgi:hypothetical protein